MANDVKWSDWQCFEVVERQAEDADPTPRTALLQLLGCVIGLGALTVVLPGPASWFGLLSGHPTGTQGLVSIGAAAETAILVTASVLVWLLLAWVLAVWIAAVAGRLPGAPGRFGRALLRRIAPAAAGRIVAAAVGVSLLAGTSACAVPAMGDLGSGASTEVVAGSTTTSTPAPLGGGAGVVDSATGAAAATPTATDPASLDDVLSSISIDWPAVVSPTSAVDTADQTISDAPADTAAPAETTPPESTPAESAPADPTSAETTPPADTAPSVASTDDPVSGNPADTGSADAAPSASSVPETAANSASTTAAPGTTEQIPTPDEPATDPTDAAQPPPTDVTQAVPTAGAPTGSDAGPTTTPTQQPSGPVTPIAGADSPGGVAVLAGDTLWSIAHHHLNPDATDQEIDTAWRAWYSANAQVIGDNPDLIQPGQLLLPPDPEMGR